MGLSEVVALLGERALGVVDVAFRVLVSVFFLYMAVCWCVLHREVLPSDLFGDLGSVLGVPTAAWAPAVQSWVTDRPWLTHAAERNGLALLAYLVVPALFFLYRLHQHFIEMRLTSTVLLLSLLVAESGNVGGAAWGLCLLVLLGWAVLAVHAFGRWLWHSKIKGEFFYEGVNLGDKSVIWMLGWIAASIGVILFALYVLVAAPASRNGDGPADRSS